MMKMAKKSVDHHPTPNYNHSWPKFTTVAQKLSPKNKMASDDKASGGDVIVQGGGSDKKTKQDAELGYQHTLVS